MQPKARGIKLSTGTRGVGGTEGKKWDELLDPVGILDGDVPYRAGPG